MEKGGGEMILTSVFTTDVTLCTGLLASSVRAVRTGVRLLSCVDSQVFAHISSACISVAADLTLVVGAVSLNVRVETLHRSQRQLT